MDEIGSVLVVGGGIAGIQSSLDLANSGFRVYLVEPSPIIGGKTAQLDCLLCKVCHRYFPETKNYEKMPCGVCYFQKMLGDIVQNRNIEILTWSHVNTLEKKGDNYVVNITKRPKTEDENDSIFPGLNVEEHENGTIDQEQNI
ncbi:MAG: FAD-dependent oxidoreductase [Thermoplasmata archaeon]|nr:FAD-dependent oxidoreductase [Thermoplasmata archaeon]